MKKHQLALLLTVSAFAFSCNRNSGNTQNAASATTANMPVGAVDVKPETAGFIGEASQGNLVEVDLGKLAQRNGMNMKVKDFALMLIKDHGQAEEQLKQVAKDKNITLPPDLGNMQPKVDSLAMLSSAGFDLAFMQTMVNAHKKDVAMYENALNTVKDTVVKSYIVKTLPTLKMHLAKAEEINQELDKKNKANYAKK